MARGYILSLNPTYKVNYTVGQTITIESIRTIANLQPNTSGVTYFYDTSVVTVTKPTGEIEKVIDITSGVVDNRTGSLTFSVPGTYTIQYSGSNGYTSANASRTDNYSFTYQIAAVENKLPLKKWTVTSVINRLLDLCEPLRKGDKPRFRLNGMDENGNIIPEGQEGSGQAILFDKIFAPQFSLTRQTLRECLQEVGKVVHGEPRFQIKKDNTGKYYYEVIYDLYASQEKANLWYKPYISKDAEWVINNYQTWVDSNAENLINQLDKLGGVIVEPYSNGAKSVRTENQYVRIEAGNMLIATQYPIYTVDKLEYVYNDGGTVKSIDITPYVFEQSEYDTRLSSYREQYPYSKAYGLYFSQGSKNIGGLNFKVDASAFAAFKNYAIVNILKQVIGSGYSLPDYPLLAFRVTYTPYYNARVAQTKTNYKDFNFPAALIYNQQSNVIESRYYGENLKGVTARLGNVEKSLMYCFKTLKKVPKAGQLFGNDYYISAVATEILPTYIRCTIGLSKDFNRISAYIGVPSEKRYYEISQSQAVDRNVLWREYIVVGDKEKADEDAISFNMMGYIADTFNGSRSANAMITHVLAKGVSYKGNDLPTVDLPVISSAFGNSVSFAWRYEDNYSAGAISQKVDNSLSGNITGYWQNDARYTDYYGRMYYYYFSLLSGGEQYTEQNSLALPQSVSTGNPYSAITNIGKEPMILRKDNREALQINFQIDFVTNTDIIIGSALASYFTAVRNGRNKYLAAVLYVFPTELNKFTDHIEGWEDVDLSKMNAVAADAYTFVGGCLVKVNTNKFPASGKSWAIIIRQLEGEKELVEDEEGNQYEYKETYGGDLLIGRNQEVTAGQEFTPIYFTPKREIFDKSVWVDIK